MEPQFQTSFIPKKPIVAGTRDAIVPERPTSILTIFSALVFIIAIIGCGALFAYQKVLVGQIDQANREIVSAKEAFQPDTIKELISVSTHIVATQKLLSQHIASSQIFDVLQSLTNKKIRYNSFTLLNREGVVTIGMDTEAQDYNALAQQSQTFASVDFLHDPQFLNFDISDNGAITSKFSATIDPNALSYKKAIDALNSNL